MGKSDRDRRQQIEQGIEKPFRHEKTPERMMFCEQCQVPVPQSKMGEHFKLIYHPKKQAKFTPLEAAHVETVSGPVS
jgi:hypothetical protein